MRVNKLSHMSLFLNYLLSKLKYMCIGLKMSRININNVWKQDIGSIQLSEESKSN